LNANLLRFVPKALRDADWSAQEIAEFYRAADMLRRAGVHVETDRGLTDEGDPWFVFFRPSDDEVIAHFARDGEFIAHAPMLDRPLRGQDLREVLSSLINTNAVALPVRGATKLHMHPAAMLIAFLATAMTSLDADGISVKGESDSDPSQSIDFLGDSPFLNGEDRGSGAHKDSLPLAALVAILTLCFATETQLEDISLPKNSLGDLHVDASSSQDDSLWAAWATAVDRVADLIRNNLSLDGEVLLAQADRDVEDSSNSAGLAKVAPDQEVVSGTHSSGLEAILAKAENIGDQLENFSPDIHHDPTLDAIAATLVNAPQAASDPIDDFVGRLAEIDGQDAIPTNDLVSQPSAGFQPASMIEVGAVALFLKSFLGDEASAEFLASSIGAYADVPEVDVAVTSPDSPVAWSGTSASFSTSQVTAPDLFKLVDLVFPNFEKVTAGLLEIASYVDSGALRERSLDSLEQGLLEKVDQSTSFSARDSIENVVVFSSNQIALPAFYFTSNTIFLNSDYVSADGEAFDQADHLDVSFDGGGNVALLGVYSVDPQDPMDIA
jgi:hypothetical protein